MERQLIEAGMRLCDSFMCAAFTVSGSPWSVIVSWLQSN
jgi:hypothetical protein